METQCIDVDRIATVLELPADHPERRHADTCARCRSIVDSYRAFVGAESVEGANLEHVRGVLDARIDKDAERWFPAEAPASSLSRASWWRALMRPAPLVAAVAVAVVAVWWTARGPEESVVREDAPKSQTVVLNDAQTGVDGNIFLSWTPVAGADRYQVRVYSADLHELYRSPDVTETSLVVVRNTLPADLPSTLNLTWEVYARYGADLIAVSPPGSIQAP